jgi:hypothetical protein
MIEGILCLPSYVLLQLKNIYYTTSRVRNIGYNVTLSSQYASRKFWLDPIDYFYAKMSEIQEILDFVVTIRKKEMSERLISILYSQLVTALEVCLCEKFKQGLQSEKGFNNFVKEYPWHQKYTPNQLYQNIKNIVESEVEHINFQNLYECGKVYNIAFNVNILSFKEEIKNDISRILRYRHALVHQDEIWEKGRFIKIDAKLLKSDIKTSSEFIEIVT